MSKTAIILFANLPEFEARAKSLSSHSPKASQKLSAVLTQHFYHLASQTRAQTFLIDSHLQKGKNFGERITHAFADIYEKGFENIICIGNDCPSLSKEQLEFAIDQTESGNVVLGPTFDGGAYLIGIPKDYFHRDTFSKLKWQSHQTLEGLENLFMSLNVKIIETEFLNDLDEEKDIFISKTKTAIINLLQHLIQTFQSAVKQFHHQEKTAFVFISLSSLKGPPNTFL